MSTRRRDVLLLALLLDLLFGDPPNRYHPVAWMGHAIARAERNIPRRGRPVQLAYGALVAVGGGTAAAWLGRLIGLIPAPLSLVIEALLLKSTFTLRGLADAAGEVESALEAGDLPGARRLVGWHLVSRDTSVLSKAGVSAAAVESVAENMSDGVVAPVLYYAAGGLPAALAYRFVNTTDSMLGYHDPVHEWPGKVPARLDDLLNLLPARLAALFIVAAARLTGDDLKGAWQVWLRDSAKTESPNAGHPMSAMAGALGVELEKTGNYRLGAGGRPAAPRDVGRSVRVVRVAVFLFVGVMALLLSSKRDAK